MKVYLVQFRERHDSKVKQFTADLHSMARAMMRVYQGLKKCAEHRARGISDESIMQRLLKDLAALTDAINTSNDNVGGSNSS